MWQVLDDAHTEENRNSRLRDDGDVERALAGAEIIEAEYRTPFLAHAALEPLSATVLIEQDRVTIWTATQVPHVVRDAAAEITGLDAAQVTLHALPAGGSFGRRLDHDYVVQAIQIAASMPGTPIKTTWRREEDMTHDFPRPLHMARARGAVADGRVVACDLDTISASLVQSWFGRVFIVPPGPDAMLVWGAYDQPYAIPNYRVTGYAAPQMVPIGSWRSPGACSNSFFHEGFLSELIHAAGADPLEERLRLIDNADSRRVLEAVGEMSNWAGADIGPGRGRGIAFAHTHGVPVAEVIDVTMTDQRNPHRRGLDRRRLRNGLRPRQRRGAAHRSRHLRSRPCDELRTDLRKPRGAANQLRRVRRHAALPDTEIPHATPGTRREGPRSGRACHGAGRTRFGRRHLCRNRSALARNAVRQIH